jgi:hypothetical protein
MLKDSFFQVEFHKVKMSFFLFTYIMRTKHHMLHGLI